MAAIFGEGKIFLKLPRVQCSDILWVKNFDEIALSRMVKEIEANLCFAIFGKNLSFWGGENFWKIAQKFENSKWPPFLGRGKFFKNYQEYNAQISCGSKILTKSLYLAWLRR